jgi:hypothetical protein
MKTGLLSASILTQSDFKTFPYLSPSYDSKILYQIELKFIHQSQYEYQYLKMEIKKNFKQIPESNLLFPKNGYIFKFKN